MVVHKQRFQGVELNRMVCFVLRDSASLIKSFCVDESTADPVHIADMMNTVGKEIGDNVNFLRDNRASYPEKTAREIAAMEETILKVMSMMVKNINYARRELELDQEMMESLRSTARDEVLPEIEAFVKRFQTAWPFPDEAPEDSPVKTMYSVKKPKLPPAKPAKKSFLFAFFAVLGGSILISLLMQHFIPKIDNLGAVFMTGTFVLIWYGYIEPHL
ncbi:MAG: hypothetical protein CVV64_16580 [Candidatus Wallbacteria bacterium HGW-Wallbacteria-1]|uniref:Uncharacterized protein n=1 Tax=Candidatus Wallbacteria bacterium HGW-Wallbacteria-1 TaxID=2013854 RepID=A0A2N1PKS5_9BACT|nr:MAG: hypothetical protein CVV64_16580 [Candidatus Wallbacteria bacterium HGW-Wallbacteria-1]